MMQPTPDNCLTWYLSLKRLQADSTQALSRSVLTRFCSFTAWPPTALTIVDFIDHCQKRGLVDSTVLTYFEVVRAFVKFLAETEQIPAVDLDVIKRPPRPLQLPRVPGLASIKALFVHLEASVEQLAATDNLVDGWRTVRDLALFSILYDCGLRVGEVSEVQCDDLDLADCSLLVRKTKRRRQRVVYFARLARGDLRLWLKVRQVLRPGIEFVFVGKRGGWKQFSSWGVRDRLRMYCDRLELKRITPHQMRHAFAAHSLKSGLDVESLQSQLGHSSVQMTMRYVMAGNDDRRVLHTSASPRDLLNLTNPNLLRL